MFIHVSTEALSDKIQCEQCWKWKKTHFIIHSYLLIVSHMYGMKYICGTATCVTWPLQVSNHHAVHHSTNHCSAASRTVLQHTLCSALKCSSAAWPDTVGEAVRSWAKAERKLQTLQKLLLLSWSGSFCSVRLYLSLRFSCANSVFIIADDLIDHGRALTDPAPRLPVLPPPPPALVNILNAKNFTPYQFKYVCPATAD